jgi:tetratricopeptide (TPR) repeat protein
MANHQGRGDMILFLLLPALLFAQLEQADEAFRQGDLARAATLAQQVLTRDPSAVHAHMILGVIAAQNNQWAVSDRHFQTVTRLQPANPHGYFYLGQGKLYQRQWEQAIQYFARAAERGYPDKDRLLIEVSMAESEAGRPKQALTRLAGVSPPSEPRLAAQYHGVIAFARDRLNQPNEAIAAAREAVKLDDSNPLYWDFLIDALIRTDQAPPALAEAILAQKKFPDRADTQFLFALASHHVVESPLSKLALRNLEEAEPGSARVALAEGLLLRKQGRHDEALAAFKRAALRGAPDAHLLLGIVYKENGDYPAAEREYLEAERLNPKSGQVPLELGKLLFARGDLAGARLRLEKAVAFMPDASTAHYQLGLVYRRLGLTAKAEEHLERSRATVAR